MEFYILRVLAYSRNKIWWKATSSSNMSEKSFPWMSSRNESRQTARRMPIRTATTWLWTTGQASSTASFPVSFSFVWSFQYNWHQINVTNSKYRSLWLETTALPTVPRPQAYAYFTEHKMLNQFLINLSDQIG